MKHLVRKTSVGSLAALILAVSGCAAYDEAIESQRAVYKKAEKREAGLDIPPDLTQQRPDEQFLLPGDPAAGVNASDYYSGRAGQMPGAQVAVVQPVVLEADDVKVNRTAGVRTLIINKPAALVYADLRNFWRESGFSLTTDDPKLGILETNWAENRADIPMDGVRKYIGRVFDGMYSASTRDRYRSRVEPLSDKQTEVYVTHRGLSEEFVNEVEGTTAWKIRPSDPELEAEMQNRFVAFLTGEKTQVAKSDRTENVIARLKKNSAGTALVLEEDFPVAWRRVGLALDRAGFLVEDRDRASGVYYVLYNPPGDRSEAAGLSNFFKDILGMRKGDKSQLLEADQRFQVSVEVSAKSSTDVRFLNEKGQNLSADMSEAAASRLLKAIE